MADPRKNIPNKNTDAKGWLDWHKSLKSVMNIDDANAVWLAYWSSYGSTWKDDRALREYMKKEGVDISSAVDSIRDKGQDVLGVFGNIFKSGMVVTLGVAAILAFAILKAVLNIAKDPIGATNAAANLKSGGIPK